MFHSIICIVASMAIGYVIYSLLYWKHNHCLVKLEIGILSAVDLLIILFVVGLVLSFL